MSEAADIVQRLMAGGMQSGEIAKAIGAKTSGIVRDISRGKATGNLYVRKLRALASVVGSATPTSKAPADSPESVPQADTPTAAADTPASAEAVATPAPPGPTAADRFKANLKAALLGQSVEGMPAAPAKRSKPGEASDTFVEQVVPIAALAVVFASHLAIPPLYAPVAPTQPEAAAVLTPLVRIMARQLEVAGQLTETQVDVLMALSAMTIYAQRAWETGQAIRRDAAQYAGYGDATPAAGHAQPSNSTHVAGNDGPQAAPAGPIARPAGRGQRGTRAPAPAPSGPGNAGDASSGGINEASPISPFADLYSADADGRRRLGLN